jgi:hypothetical protein
MLIERSPSCVSRNEALPQWKDSQIFVTLDHDYDTMPGPQILGWCLCYVSGLEQTMRYFYALPGHNDLN